MKIQFTPKNQSSEVTYPTLRKWTSSANKSKNFTVLFFAPETGVVVESNNTEHKVGKFCNHLTFGLLKGGNNNDIQWTEAHGEVVFKC